jgi:hypothetical protein
MLLGVLRQPPESLLYQRCSLAQEIHPILQYAALLSVAELKPKLSRVQDGG